MIPANCSHCSMDSAGHESGCPASPWPIHAIHPWVLPVRVALVRMDHDALDELPIPARATPEAAGYDVCSRVTVTIAPGDRALVPTGWAMALPVGYECQVRPRSGLALKAGVTVLNTPGTIDSDYRGELMVILINHSPVAFDITRGMRIAQLVIAPVTPALFTLTDVLPSSDRGAGGFGSTG